MEMVMGLIMGSEEDHGGSRIDRKEQELHKDNLFHLAIICVYFDSLNLERKPLRLHLTRYLKLPTQHPH